MGRAIVITGLLLLAGPLHAEVYAYRCKEAGKILSLSVDDARNELNWKGKTYKLTAQEGCAKFGWHAERQGAAFNFCTATKGYADFEDKGTVVQCEQKR